MCVHVCFLDEQRQQKLILQHKNDACVLVTCIGVLLHRGNISVWIIAQYLLQSHWEKKSTKLLQCQFGAMWQQKSQIHAVLFQITCDCEVRMCAWRGVNTVVSFTD
jgi:hypothetical protein